MKNTNKVYLYRYFYALIIFLGILALAFLFMNFENQYNKIVDEYNDIVRYAVSEEFTGTVRNEVLDKLAEVEEARIVNNYRSFTSTLIIIIFLSLFNYFYIRFGYKFNLLKESAGINLNKRILLLISIIEIIYFVGLQIFGNPTFIGLNLWTLFLVNIIIVVFIVVIALQIEYFLKNRSEDK